MNFLFVGSIIPSELTKKYKGSSVAGNKMQLGIIQGLSKLPDCNIHVLSTYPIASFPKERVLFMRKSTFSLSTGEKITSIPFINIFILKQFTQIIGLFLGLVQFKKSYGLKNSLILTFNAYPEWSFPVMLFSRIYEIKKICLLADLPIHKTRIRTIRQFVGELQSRTTFLMLKKFDGLITLNEEAQKKFAPHLPFCSIDGGIVLNDYQKPLAFGGSQDDNEYVILFTGALVEYNGIANLVLAIKKIKEKNLKFIFYGEGPLTQMIINESIRDSRICYCGSVPNTEILSIQKKSSFLINPRPTKNLLSQITFPSKILEYMMSGTPILTTRLNGLVNDYKDFLFFIGDEPETMAVDIVKALSIEKDILISRSQLAYKFVSENRTWDIHARTIYNFSKDLLNI